MKIQHSLSLFGLISASVIVSPLVHAQPIIPANDGTGTQIIPHNNQWNIQGGQRSSDGSNLFHSFQNFNVNTGQIVNFISEPNIQNILGRVTGGQASIIDGLIQVLGGNSNLFLINPAGIVFGSNASLNIPAAFTVTTADAIGFGQGNWFNSIGNNNWSTLVGTPSEFQFNSPQPGAIINLGELNINSGQSLRLVGGTVINEGSLNAPSGEIYVQTVPGQSLVKISQIGHALSLEITPNLIANSVSINPLLLPELLTGSGLNSATQTTLNQAGEIVLSNGLSVNSGDVIMASGARVNAQTANLQASNNLTLAENQLLTTGDLNLIATNTVTIRDGQTPFQANAGGNLTIQGNQNIDILALNHPITPLQSQGNMTLISDGIISGDAHFSSGGNFSILNLRGTGGNFVSLYDPIISSEADVIFGDYTGSSLKIESKGAISGGNINITTPDTSLTNIIDPDAEILRNSPALILKSGVQILANPVNLAPDSEFTTAEDQIISSQSNLFSGNNLISVGEVITAGGPVLLESASEIFVDSIATQGGNINLNAVNNILVTNTLNSQGGSINLTTGGVLQVQGILLDQNGIPVSISSENGSNGGAITIQYQGGETVPFVIGDSTLNGTAGAITTGSETIQPPQIIPNSNTFSQGNITIINKAIPINNPSDNTDNILPDQEDNKNPLDNQNENPLDNQTDSNQPEPPDIVDDITLEPNEQPGDNGEALGGIMDENSPLNLEEDSPQILEQDNAIVLDDSPMNEGENSPIDDKKIEGEDANQMEAPEADLPLNETTNIAAVDAGIEGLETEINNSFESGNFEQAVSGLENLIGFEYSNYFGTNFNSPETPSSQISQVLSSLDQQTNTKSALIYVYSRENELEIVLVRSNGSILHRNVPGVNQKILVDLIKEFRLEISSSRKNKQGAYLEKAQQLYQWIIAPIEAELKQENIEILMFTMDAILRGIPLAALHDGKQFLVEKYALSLIPSFNLVNTQYRSTAQATVLAMGASQFQDQNPLPAVPVELSTVTSELNTNQYFLNQDFTLINLKNQYKTNPTPIIHLATHADFKPGDASNSYIHLWDQKLPLNQLSQLGLSDPTVDLLVLSACRTAVGDKNAELGFAGLAVASGAKSVLASLWYVSDEGTLGLMSEFYHHLDTMGIKAKALQAAQIAMIRGQVRIEEGRLILVNQNQEITLPPDLKNLNNDELNYPYYWAAFTLVGSPW
ncbi:Filamentous hemagglutinin family outer membrane protein [Planktothrix tepida]|uniref:Filamentous hemagglutinin family outer membrane protein n=1 Tax=Planktothrix tepida PCC 9214 TaxID=671072 RepID=A0A1J1LE48_9CYAN|nr:CHAT domain-containing protein [Planktothrix tepida]CAD5917037.1 Filamentous hemagglutinin family outer membrane protein [Planktothrix tepida]CUR30704.1 Filamentous hemagglutinin family outer membrane protein [Planktothrix tepida PCC 9214]